ncbi:MAG: MerR family transcriptional regulator [Chloroflexi bacterium]|nr:MerR family transcriptional regulator [Chloroflexota bacterium]
MNRSEGVYIISVAARLLNLHPQTLRKYERAGFITPARTIGMLRLYSAEDIARLRLIKYLVEDLGLNLAGVQFVLNLASGLVALDQLLSTARNDREAHQRAQAAVGELLEELGLRQRHPSG